ncbi:EAL domain-containing protein [Siminovitchia acidinfaciens]|uniref:EAL domain-containing protein n=1 Tax=Siminovitchia acidinfaciens TaxID=2321395 RepID=A0A429Y7I2_9BACI|nr:EAL domain-containing protein [Siminovitchia acidinfaciens]RST77365.1 EAL domain-containing protein [Siminovitchia acidinfaciens]
MELPRFFKKKGNYQPVDPSNNFLFDAYPNPVYILDKDLRITAINKAFKKQLAFQPKELNDILNTLRPLRQMYKVKQHYVDALKGKPLIFETKNILKINQLVDFKNHLIPFGNKNVTGLMGIMKDITAVKQQNDELMKLQKNIEASEKLMDMGIWDYDIIEDRITWSDKMYEIFGVNRKVVPTSTNMLQYIHPEDLDFFKKSFQRSIEEGIPWKMQYRIIRSDGEEELVHQYADIVLDDNKKPVRLIGSAYVIPQQEEQEDRFEEDQLYQHLEACAWAVDYRTNQYIYCSQGIESLTGYTVKEFLNKEVTWNELIVEDDFPAYHALRYDIKEPGFVLEYRIRDKAGTIKWVQDKTIALPDSSGKLTRLDGIIIDITEQKKVYEKMRYIVNHDFLTKLPNRRKFDAELERCLKRTDSEFALMTIDIDGFKRINGALDYDIGDQLLVEVASRITKFVTTYDIAARMGGDEFSILFTRIVGVHEIKDIAERLIHHLNRPYYVGEHEVHITASIGIAHYPDDGFDADTLLKRSQMALHHSKSRGKSTYLIYTPSMDIESFKAFELERDLRKAIKQNELSLYFQPIVQLETNQMVRAEALLRWNHPDWKLVSPNEFIPIAEENGFIHNLTDWTLWSVCTTLSRWKEQALPLIPISINVSPKRFLMGDWADAFIRIMEETKVDPALIELEITESVLIQNEEGFQRNIEKLKTLGVKLSLDDFGTGYSSLLYLKKYNVDNVKIDRSFINEQMSKKDCTITKAIIRLTHELGMEVIAEGVETKEQLQLLKKSGCDQVQGYLFSKPLLKEHFEKLLVQPVLTIKEKPKNEMKEERRQSSRSSLSYPISAQMTISKINEKIIRVGKTEVFIQNFSWGGLCILTDLKLPVSKDFLLKLEVESSGKTFTLYGSIVWKEERKKGYFKYGMRFAEETAAMPYISELVNSLESLKK